jgi:hypothetical protein
MYAIRTSTLLICYTTTLRLTRNGASSRKLLKTETRESPTVNQNSSSTVKSKEKGREAKTIKAPQNKTKNRF